MYRSLSYFFIYSFIGWCCEVCYAAMVEGRFVNRGFLNGPVCPIYGFGMLLIICVLYPHRDQKLLVFLGAVLLMSLLELSAGFVLEKIFHQRWWDYSDFPFNIGGYICLKFSVFWGLAVLLVVEVVHPVVSRMVGFVPRSVGWVLLGVFSFVLLADLVGTVFGMMHFNARLSQLSYITARLHNVSDRIGSGLSEEALLAVGQAAALRESAAKKKEELTRTISDNETLEQLREKQRALATRLTFMQRRILRAFPGMRSKDAPDALEQMKKAAGKNRRDDA